MAVLNVQQLLRCMLTKNLKDVGYVKVCITILKNVGGNNALRI